MKVPKIIAISIVCFVVLGLSIPIWRTMVDSQKWVIVETGTRVVCSDCGKILSEMVEGKKVRTKEKHKYKVKVEKILCEKCELKREGINNGWEYLVKKKEILTADRFEVYSVDIRTSPPTKILRAAFCKGDGNFENIIDCVKHAKATGTIVRMPVNGSLVFYSGEKELVELGFNSIDYRIEIYIEKQTNKKFTVFLSSQTGEFIASYLNE